MDKILDPDSGSGRVYRALVAHPRSSVEALAGSAGLAPAEVEAALACLAEENAVVRAEAGTWEAIPPGEIVEALLRREALARGRLRQAAAELDGVYRFARREAGRYHALEVVDDHTRAFETYRRLQEQAQHQVRVIDAPPYTGTPEYYDHQEVVQRERMAAGVAYRVIYFESAFDDPIAGPNMARMIEAGEQARTLEAPPMKLVICDDDLAVVTVPHEGPAGIVALLVRPSGLFQTVAGVFESLWRLAVPVSADGADAALDERDRRILTLMASGATDEAIARRLGLSRRTVVRRVAGLQGRLGATTRFQAGVQAARRGWL